MLSVVFGFFFSGRALYLMLMDLLSTAVNVVPLTSQISFSINTDVHSTLLPHDPTGKTPIPILEYPLLR